MITGTWQGVSDPALITTPNDPFLYIGGTFTKSTRVKVGANYLLMSSIMGFDRAIPNWLGTTTATPGAPSTPVYWAPVGLTEIALYPADATVLGTPVVVDGVRNLVLLVNDADFLDLGDEEIDTLLGYALHALSFYKGADALKATRPLLVAFLKAAIKRNAVFAASDNMRKVLGRDYTRFAEPMEQAEGPQQNAALAAIAGGQ